MTEWRPTADSPNHEVSEFGDIRRTTKIRNHLTGQLLTPQITTHGYLRITVMAAGRKAQKYVHHIVCEAWHGPRPSPEHRVAHADGNKLNNHFSNLRWATHLENEADKKLHGTDMPLAKLDWEKVGAIRADYGGGSATISELSRRFDVSYPTIFAVVRGRSWK